VLWHLGGSTPFLASRVEGLSRYLGTSLSEDELIEDFHSFYNETTNSGFETNLLTAESFTAQDHLLFGTDFPAIPVETAAWYTNNVAPTTNRAHPSRGGGPWRFRVRGGG
jgi:predicted TIM-barrel fold metal-dependent hydrolase